VERGTARVRDEVDMRERGAGRPTVQEVGVGPAPECLLHDHCQVGPAIAAPVEFDGALTCCCSSSSTRKAPDEAACYAAVG
jgi:hypothetical protein